MFLLPSSRQAKYRCCTLEKHRNAAHWRVHSSGWEEAEFHSSLERGSQLNVQRAVRGPHIADANKQDIYEGPDAQATKAEELAKAFPPLAQVEAVCSEATQGDAQSQGRGPLVASSPVAVQHFGESAVTEAVNMVPHGTVGVVTLPGTGHCHAAGVVGTLVITFWKLPAKSASHIDGEVLLGFEILVNTGDRGLDRAVKCDRLPIDTRVVCPAFYAVGWKSAT